MLHPPHASQAGMRKVETMHLKQCEHLENWGLRIVRCCLLFLTTVGNTWDFPTSQSTLHPHPLLPLDKNWSRPNSTRQKKQLLDCIQVWRETKKTNERSTMPKPCLYVYVTVYMDMCVWVCVCLCMSVCCCTLGSSCRFEVGSPGAHSDNCTSIIFCSSILCFFFFS